MPPVPVHSFSCVYVISLAAGPVYPYLTIIPHQVGIVPVKSWVLGIAVQQLAVVQVNLWLLAVVTNRLAVAVVAVCSTDFPAVV